MHPSMLSWFTLFVLCSSGARVLSSSLGSPTLSSEALSSAYEVLNVSVSGRLHAALPLELPCFSLYDGRQVVSDEMACTTIQENYTVPTYRVDSFGAYMLPQWESCQSSDVPEECLLNSSDPTDSLAYTGVDCSLGNIPSYYIEVQEITDIQAALLFSQQTGVRLSVKNKGHDYKGRSSGKGTLSIWVSKFNADLIEWDESFTPEGCDTTYDAITVGAGVILEDVYAYADSVNRTFIGGYHQTIGIAAGWVLGGGHSILTPVYGLGIDRVIQYKVVTPDGMYRVVNECQNSDLFWAMRGGGGSAWGIVVESAHRVEPQVTLQVASLAFTPNTTTGNLADWYDLTINETYKWGMDGWGGHIVGPTLIYVTPLLDNAAANTSMQTASNFVLEQGGTAVVEELPSWYAFFQKYVTLAEAGVGPELTLGTRLLDTTLFSTEQGRTTLSNTVRAVLPFASPYIVAGTPFLYNWKNGSTSATPAWRTSLWHLSVKGQFEWNSTLAERTQVYARVSEHVDAFRTITPGSGSYFSEGDVYEPDHEYSYWGDNYPRLLEIKRKYDPLGLLQCWQCVGWQGQSDPLYQCHIKLNSSVASTMFSR
ncbi:FAD-binding domain-containing protein [Amylocystis lapponica]|nr:FAD-binding domain-containing protein [Amylocystis lapponica]